MTEIVIDHNKCNRDGICAASCPLHLFKIDEETNIPYLDEKKADSCINCGHCISVCSQDALTLNGTSPEQLTQIKPELIASTETVKQLLRTRRSIRKFKDKSVDKETLVKLIDMANHAPTGRNLHEISWKLIDDKKKVRELAGMVVEWMKRVSQVDKKLAEYFQGAIKSWEKGHDNVLRGAPAFAIAVAPKDAACAVEDGATAIAYLELAAHSLNLGTCWAGYFYFAVNSSPDIRKYLAISDDEKCVGAAMLGYPSFKYYRIPSRDPAPIEWI